MGMRRKGLLGSYLYLKYTSEGGNEGSEKGNSSNESRSRRKSKGDFRRCSCRDYFVVMGRKKWRVESKGAKRTMHREFESILQLLNHSDFAKNEMRKIFSYFH